MSEITDKKRKQLLDIYEKVNDRKAPSNISDAKLLEVEQDYLKEKNKMKVRFLKVPGQFNLAYYKGDEAEFNHALGQELVDAKVAEIITENNMKK